MLFAFFAVAASGFARLLADSAGQLNFTAGDFSAERVLLIDAGGAPCASGLGGDAGTGLFRASFEVPYEHYYRIDAHSAGEECEGGSEVNILIDSGRQWSTGRWSSGNYTQVEGWMPLMTDYFLPGHPGRITQTGAFDAFRVVALTPTRNHHRGYPPFGSLSLDTDAVAMPPGFVSDLQELTGLGDALTASFRPQAVRARRLKTGFPMGFYANQVVIDFDMSDFLPAQSAGEIFWTENPKLLDSLMPKKADLLAATRRICNVLNTVECGNVVSFRLEKTGEVVTYDLNLPDVDVKELDDGEASKTRTTENGEERSMFHGRLGVKTFTGLMIVLGSLVLALRCAVFRLLRRQQIQPELEKSPPRDAKDETKPAVGRVVDDDTVSTATPVSLAHTAALSEDLPVDQV
jgi:hypothetical protein